MRTRFDLVGVLVLGLAAGCTGTTCSGLRPLAGGFPEAERIAGGVQVRISSHGLERLESSAPQLVTALAPEGLSFPIPKVCEGDPKLCCDEPDGYCRVNFDVNARGGDAPRLELNPAGENRLHVVLRPRAHTPNNLKIDKEVTFFTVSCDVGVNTERSGANSLRVETDVTFEPDPASGTARVTIGQVSINDLDDDDVEITGNIACAAANTFLKGQILDSVRGGFEEQATRAVQTLVCKACANDDECGPGGTCEDQICMTSEEGPRRCIQELGTSGRIATTGLLDGPIPTGPTGALDLFVVAGGGVSAPNDGFSFDVMAGAALADGRGAACVPPAPEPEIPAGGLPEASFYRANEGAVGPFDLALGVHKVLLDRVGWSAYSAGLLCLSMGTEDVPLLNATSLSLLAPSLSDLLFGSGAAEVMLAVRPRKPPTFKIGAGNAADPLLTLEMPELGIDLYVRVDGRPIRLATLESDLVVPFGLEVDADGRITPVLGDLAAAFTNLRVVNSKVLAESNAEIVEKVPSVLALALPFLGDVLGQGALPDIAGLSLRPVTNGFQGIDDGAVLAVYADIVGGPPARELVASTAAHVIAVETPTLAQFRASHRDRAHRPRIRVALGADDGGDPRQLEWQVRLDDGFWSPFARDRELVLEREALWLAGRHKLEVRARVIGAPGSLDPTPVVLEAIVDPLGPRVALRASARRLQIDAHDAVTRDEDLVAELREGGGDWRRVAVATPIAIDGAVEQVEVRVRDEAGNQTVIGGTEATRDPRLDAGGCTVSPGGAGRAGRTAALIIAAAGLAGLWLRRRGAALLATAAVATLVPGCSCSGSISDDGFGETIERAVSVGRWVDVASDGSRVLFAAYELKYGDLVVGTAGEAGTLAGLTVVDGVPEGAPSTVDGPTHRGGVTQRGDDVGAWASVALTNGRGVIAYQDLTNGALKLAMENGEDGGWTSSLVDPGDGGEAGRWASLTIDAAGLPGVAYVVLGLQAADGSRTTELRWAQALVERPAGPADWAIETVVGDVVPCTGLCQGSDVCVTASESCQPLATGCEGCGDDQACVAGACAQIRETPDYTVLPAGPGYAAAGRLGDGRPVIAFRQDGALLLARKDAEAWTVLALDDGGDRGHFADLLVVGETIHVAHQDVVDYSLHHVSVTGDLVAEGEIVDDGFREGGLHPVGASPVLFQIGTELGMLYQDQADVSLRVARHGPAGWRHEELVGGRLGAGFFNAIATAAGGTTVATYVIDRRYYPPGGLEFAPLPSP